MGEEMAKQNNMKFFETSAKTGEGIQEAFETIARDIIANIDREKMHKEKAKPTPNTEPVRAPGSFNLDNKGEKPKKSKKCC